MNFEDQLENSYRVNKRNRRSLHHSLVGRRNMTNSISPKKGRKDGRARGSEDNTDDVEDTLWYDFMVILTFIIVVLRYVFSIGFIWMQELVRYLYATVFLLCSAYTLAEDGHVRVDIFYSKMKDKHRAIVNLLGSLVFLIPVCLSILYFSYNYVINSWAQLEGSLEERGLHGVFLIVNHIFLESSMQDHAEPL